MIERIELTNFKTHAHTVVELERLTVLVGPNSSGKTSVLEGLRCMTGAEDGHSGLAGIGATAVPGIRRGAEEARFRVCGMGRCVEGRLRTQTKGSHSPHSRGREAGDFHLEEVADQHPPGHLPTHEEIYIPFLGEQDSSKLRVLFHTRSLLTQLHIESLRSASGFGNDGATESLDPDGRNLAAMVALLKLTEDGSFRALVDDLSAVVPTVDNIHAMPYEARFRLALDFAGARHVPATTTSEGTLVALALLMYVHEPNPPTLLLIDDIDRGLHLGAQRELVGILQRLLDRRPELQIVVTTHSPYIVEAVDPSAVRVCALRKDGTAAIKPLLAHPEADRALEVLNAAEFWEAEGEDWVTEEA